MYVLIRACMCTYVQVSAYVHVSAHTCMYVRIHARMCSYMHTPRKTNLQMLPTCLFHTLVWHTHILHFNKKHMLKHMCTREYINAIFVQRQLFEAIQKFFIKSFSYFCGVQFKHCWLFYKRSFFTKEKVVWSHLCCVRCELLQVYTTRILSVQGV
jgi:hypothetical protein